MGQGILGAYSREPWKQGIPLKSRCGAAVTRKGKLGSVYKTQEVQHSNQQERRKKPTFYKSSLATCTLLWALPSRENSLTCEKEEEATQH